MKVLHLINNLNREGAQVMVARLVTTAKDGVVDYLVCVREPGGVLAKDMIKQDVTVIEPPSYYGFRRMGSAIRFVERAVHEHGIDVIHAHMADAAFIGWRAAAATGVPLVISHHGHDILMQCNPLCRILYHILLIRAAHYAAMNIAVSPRVAERVRKLLFLPDARVRVIANGVDLPDPGSNRARISLTGSVLRLVTVGRLVAQKGYRELISAFAAVQTKYTGARLTIVGGGELEDELKQFAAEQAVEANIEFTGHVDDVSPFLDTADIYVSSSRSEGMPVSILEAMAYSLPVVASDIPGNRSVVSDRQTGLLFKAGETGSLLEAVDRLIDDPGLARAMAARGREQVESQYTIKACVRAHETLYISVAGGLQ